MKIDRINIKNFRSYRDSSDITLDQNNYKNIFVIAGKNGFGKTSFLTALVWAFYGKLFTQVENKYKKDVQKHGGYNNYLKTQFNNSSKNNLNTRNKNDEINVEIDLSEITIPSIHCDSVKIKRSYNINTEKESLQLLIDDQENELTKEVGYDVFINDFILPREIAKFFFFDAEKIVELAEAKTKDELRTLSKAYSEVLGIKKYEDLKYNLETLISNLKRKGISNEERKKLDDLKSKDHQLAEIIDLNKEQQRKIDQSLSDLKQEKDSLQEKLIREGTAITLEELNYIKEQLIIYKKQDRQIKADLKDYYELLPFLIAKNQVKKLYERLVEENQMKNKADNQEVFENEINSIYNALKNDLDDLVKNEEDQKSLLNWFEKQRKQKIKQKKTQQQKILFEFSDQEFREFESFYNYLKGDFKKQLEDLQQKHKEVKYYISKYSRKIKEYENKGDNYLVKEIRVKKKNISSEIDKLEKQKTTLAEKYGEENTKLISNRKVISEYENRFNLFEKDLKKYNTTKTLLQKIDHLIKKIKEEKKYSLQASIKEGLNTLMHKESFISEVNVIIKNEIMDIELLDQQGNTLEKENLSKGEQQLYATALLNALVEESGIKFPVIIDSPLQKIDKQHSENIIKDFYPKLSNQVIVLPLLEKELSKEEFEMMKPMVSKSFKIEQDESKNSFIASKKVDELFNEEEKLTHVHSH